MVEARSRRVHVCLSQTTGSVKSDNTKLNKSSSSDSAERLLMMILLGDKVKLFIQLKPDKQIINKKLGLVLWKISFNSKLFKFKT